MAEVAELQQNAPQGMRLVVARDISRFIESSINDVLFDLSLVRYNKQAVTVVASGGNLHLGGIDWNAALEKWAVEQFVKETPNEDPRLDRHSMQALANDIEQAKRAREFILDKMKSTKNNLDFFDMMRRGG